MSYKSILLVTICISTLAASLENTSPTHKASGVHERSKRYVHWDEYEVSSSEERRDSNSKYLNDEYDEEIGFDFLPLKKKTPLIKNTQSEENLYSKKALKNDSSRRIEKKSRRIEKNSRRISSRIGPPKKKAPLKDDFAENTDLNTSSDLPKLRLTFSKPSDKDSKKSSRRSLGMEETVASGTEEKDILGLVYPSETKENEIPKPVISTFLIFHQLRENLLYFFGCLLQKPVEFLTEPQYTSLYNLYLELRNRPSRIHSLLSNDTDLNSILNTTNSTDQSKSLNSQIKTIMSMIGKFWPSHIACGANFWVEELEKNRIDFENLPPNTCQSNILENVIINDPIEIPVLMTPVDTPTKITESVLGGVFVKILYDIQNLKLTLTQSMFGIILYNLPLIPYDPVLEEYIRFVYGLTIKAKIPSWREIDSQATGDVYRFVKTIIGNILILSDVPQSIKEALVYIRIHLKPVPTTHINPDFPNVHKISTNKFDIKFLLSFIVPNVHSKETICLKNRFLKLVQKRALPDSWQLSEMDRLRYTNPEDLLFAYLTKLQKTVPKKDHELSGTVTALLSVLIIDKQNKQFAPITKNTEIFALFGYLASPDFEHPVHVVYDKFMDMMLSNPDLQLAMTKIVPGEKGKCSVILECLKELIQKLEQLNFDIPRRLEKVIDEMRDMIPFLKIDAKCRSGCSNGTDGEIVREDPDDSQEFVRYDYDIPIDMYPEIEQYVQHGTISENVLQHGKHPIRYHYTNDVPNDVPNDFEPHGSSYQIDFHHYLNAPHDGNYQTDYPNYRKVPHGSAPHGGSYQIEYHNYPNVPHGSAKHDGNYQIDHYNYRNVPHGSVPHGTTPHGGNFQINYHHHPDGTVHYNDKENLVLDIFPLIQITHQFGIYNGNNGIPIILHNGPSDNKTKQNSPGNLKVILPSIILLLNSPEINDPFGSMPTDFKLHIRDPLIKIFGPDELRTIDYLHSGKSSTLAAFLILELEKAKANPLVQEDEHLLKYIKSYISGLDLLAIIVLPLILKAATVFPENGVIYSIISLSEPHKSKIFLQPPTHVPPEMLVYPIVDPFVLQEPVDLQDPFENLLPNDFTIRNKELETVRNHILELKTFFTKKTLLPLLPNFKPEEYPSKGVLLVLILQKLPKLPEIASNTKLKKFILGYIWSIVIPAYFSNVPYSDILTILGNQPKVKPDTEILIKILPEPENEKEHLHFEVISGLLGRDDLFEMLGIRKPKSAIDQTELLMMIITSVIKLSPKLDPRIVEACKFYRTKMSKVKKGFLPIAWEMEKHEVTKCKIQLGDLIEDVIDYDKLTDEEMDAYNGLMKYFTENSKIFGVIQDFEFQHYETEGRFIKGLLQYLLKSEIITEAARNSIKVLLPYVQLDGPGAKNLKISKNGKSSSGRRRATQLEIEM